MATQEDIARISGFDRTSVSKILCGYHLENFSCKAVESVRAVAARLGYRHRNFRDAMIIGLVLGISGGDYRKYFVSERTLAALLGINEYLGDSKHRLQTIVVDDSQESFDFEGVAGRADAFIIWELTWPWTHPFYEQLGKREKDYIVINRVEDGFAGSYIIHESDNNYISNALSKLLDAGHRKIAGVLGHSSDGLVKGAAAAFAAFGLDSSRDSLYWFDECDVEGCQNTARRIAEGGFSAVFVQSNDMSAYNLVIELAGIGVRVPDDLSVIGNHKSWTMPRVGLDLNSFETPWFEMGKRAARALTSRAGNDRTRQTPIREVLPQKYYKGNSVRVWD